MDQRTIIATADGRCAECGQPLYRPGNLFRPAFGFGLAYTGANS